MIVILVLAALLFAPVTGYLAAMRGRSFWRWYALGMVLPFCSMFVILLVSARDELAAERAARRPAAPEPEK
ncbi:hypothetical protein [uncultured Hymenobacter sp.]|uniref:hypothetical protein n=1 Tax=uncultured Hymenobacter sp. TaxID=170016 RepID=UPI0035CBD1C5